MGGDAAGVGEAAGGDKEGEVHEQDGEAKGGADADGDAFAGHVGGLGHAAGEAGAGDRVGVADGAVGRDEAAVVALVVTLEPPEIRLGVHTGECARDGEREPEEEVAGDVGARVDRPVAGDED